MRSQLLKVPMGQIDWGIKDIFDYLILKTFQKNKFKDQLNTKFSLFYDKDLRFVFLELGRQAIYLSLKSLELKSSDEVIIPSYACANVLLPILANNYTPVFADCGKDLNISLESVRSAINAKTKVLIIPHMYGNMASISEFRELANQHNLVLIDDAAQAFGASLGNNFAGSFGDYGILSFGPFKSLPASKGGILLSTSHELYPSTMEASQILPERGMTKSLDITVKCFIKFGLRKAFFLLRQMKKNKLDRLPFDGQEQKRTPNFLNFHEMHPRKMSELDSFIINRLLEKAEDRIRRRRKLAKLLISYLEKSSAHFSLPDFVKTNIFTKFIIILKESVSEEKRDLFIDYLNHSGIESYGGYKPLHLQERFTAFTNNRLKYTESVWRRVVCLPLSAKMKNDDIVLVKNVINNFQW